MDIQERHITHRKCRDIKRQLLDLHRGCHSYLLRLEEPGVELVFSFPRIQDSRHLASTVGSQQTSEDLLACYSPRDHSDYRPAIESVRVLILQDVLCDEDSVFPILLFLGQQEI
ncbi:hypothetical protein J6590_040718 [Homalodisca vitripennis]|nr:hypothetical protein J6590_040718 [Homalodisca vitripennis]